MSGALASNSSRLSLEGKGCQKHFTSHENKVPAQKLTTFQRLCQPGCQPPKPSQGQLGGLSTFSGRWEGRERSKQGPKMCTRGDCLPLPWPLSDKEGPDDLCMCWGVCVCVNTHTFFPCLHLITLDALLIIHSPNTKHPPPQPAPPPQLRLSFPTDLPRARNKLPIICIMLHDALLHASNHFSISFRKNPSRIILSKLN